MTEDDDPPEADEAPPVVAGDIETETEVRDCPHCSERHEVEVVVGRGWERLVYCPRTGTM